jgi:activator of 2-hydroxyglutaryl-CoA dehydratase
MCTIKEKGVDLANPKNRDEEALALYIRSLIKYVLENIAIQFKKVQSSLDLPEPIPFIVSGGTSKAGGFMKVFTDEFEAVKKRGFPIQISEIRSAKDPMTAVAEGLLVLAMEEHAG